eukprot:219048_1
MAQEFTGITSQTFECMHHKYMELQCMTSALITTHPMMRAHLLHYLVQWRRILIDIYLKVPSQLNSNELQKNHLSTELNANGLTSSGIVDYTA